MTPNSAGRGIGRVFNLFGPYPAMLMFGLLKMKRTIYVLTPAPECGRNSWELMNSMESPLLLCEN